MKIEKLKKDNKKKWIVGSVVIVAIFVTITYLSTRANWRSTSSIQLASGVINYSPTDFEIIAIKVQNSNNKYDDVEEVPTSGYQLNTTLSTCKVGENKQDVTITYENGKINILNITTKGNKCEIYFDKAPMPLKEAILANNTIDTSRATGPFNAVYATNTVGKIFSAEDDDGTTYFFAGSSPNNWVSFAGFYWRVIRINGDGSIRLIYNGSTTNQTGASTQIGTSKFSHKDAYYTSSTDNAYVKDNAYVGYMYGTADASSYADTHTNTNSSAVKQVLDTWYNNNLKINYEKYIDINAGFCGDREVPTSGYGSISTTYYAFNRAWNRNRPPTYKCANGANDLYTWKNKSNKGNRALTYPIGLMTSDEAMFAGAKGGDSSNFWLNTGQLYWTMSPARLDDYSANVFYLLNDGSLYFTSVGNLEGVRPVINLKTDILTLGSGTTSDPYRIA